MDGGQIAVMTPADFHHIKRPEELFRLFARLTALPGVGDKVAKLLEKKMGGLIIDLLRHLPVGLIDRTKRPALNMVEHGSVITVEVTITNHDKPPKASRRPFRVTAHNETGYIDIVFFHARGDYVEKLLPIGARRVISGRAEWFQNKVQMAHPDHVVTPEKLESLPSFEPVYPLTAGLTSKVLGKAMGAAIDRIPKLQEWIDQDILTRFNWPAWDAAMRQVHAPKKEHDVLPGSPSRSRLAYDELLANQLALALVRQSSSKQTGRVTNGDGSLQEKLLTSLPFQLTGAQKRVVAEILADQQSEDRMLRLVQGDVGSGKTLVALMAMLNAVETRRQAAMLVPTEILARQHHQTLSRMLEPLGIKPGLLLGKMKIPEKRSVLEGIADGSIPIVIGTHALLTDTVVFHDLALGVVDEQHRFGVRQRLVLGEKGQGVDVLVMTATPIPRTLAMTAYGDLLSSRIDEKPPGRKDITTTALPLERVDAVIERLRAALSRGQRVYWICPLVDESDAIDVAAAEERHIMLKAALPEANTALVHGRMDAETRETAMEAFRSGESRLLVATTVVEVGVDVPEASIMIIEHAERFGLAQMHQLRGRVGRGEESANCVLLYKAPLSETAKARLSIMRDSNDGFRIAEEDLKLRGPGEVLGRRQSGDPDFQLADLAYHGDLLELAYQQVTEILEKNPALNGKDGQNLKTLLALFERDMAVTYLSGG